jgi:hypothetical protein
MKTIPVILPIYDSLAKQDRTRTKTQMPVLTPTTKLPSFQWNVESDNPGGINDIQLIGDSGTVNSGLQPVAPVNVDYAAFTVSGNSLTSVIQSGAGNKYGRLTGSHIYAGVNVMVLKCTLTLNSGQLPSATFRNAAGFAAGYETIQLKAGANTVYLHPIAGATAYCCVLNTAASNFALTNITFEYSALNYFLVGQDSINQYGFTPDTAWDAWDTANEDSATRKLDLIKSTAANNCAYKFFSTASVQINSEFYIIADLTLNSGTAPKMAILDIASGHAVLSNVVTLVNGLNIISLKATATNANARVELYNVATEVSNFSIVLHAVYKSVVPRLYTPLTNDYFIYNGGTLGKTLPLGSYCLKFMTANGMTYYSDWFSVVDTTGMIKIDFHDTHDLGDILYQEGFTQECFLEASLNTPTHEIVEVGEEKNGIFIAEKIITKYKYRIVAYIGRELYKALVKLPQHDSIVITDEIGNIYTIQTGNVAVLPANWIYYDVCRAEILFNDSTEFIWTSENNNLT